MKKILSILTPILYLIFLAGCSKSNDLKTSNTTNDVKDIDGNQYQIVNISNQVWIKQNLTVSKYRNGDVIPQVTDPSQWKSLTTGAWCYYNNEPKNGAVYGKLYNWYAVNDPRGLAPPGYHIPTKEEWTTLNAYLGNSTGGKMKEIGTALWKTPNTGATNSSGFSGLPGGYRYESGAFIDITETGSWWCTSDYNSSFAYWAYLNYNFDDLYRNHNSKNYGFSVRCLKD